ncbi:MAG: hypothetical protein IKQ92_06725 [Clostridia bacterium]|nr:hypothetical protein [Clostridia bacterium]
MKKLFVYYSLSGNGEAVAQAMAEKGYELRRAVPVKPMPKSFAGQILKGGFRAGIGAKEKLADFDFSAEGYDEIVFGSPIWNGRIVPAINTALCGMKTEGKTVSFALWSASGEAKPALKRIAKEYPGRKTAVLKNPKDNPDELGKLGKLGDL